MPRLGPALAALAIAVVAAGCFAFGPDNPHGARCDGVEAQMCNRLIDEVSAGQADVVSVVVRCATGACDQHAGDVSISVGYGDGRIVNRMIGWSAAGLLPGLAAAPTCENIKIDQCIAQVARSLPVGQAASVATIHVRCKAKSCGSDGGEGVTRLTFRDGTSREEGWAYALAPEPASVQP